MPLSHIQENVFEECSVYYAPSWSGSKRSDSRIRDIDQILEILPFLTETNQMEANSTDTDRTSDSQDVALV